MTEKLKINDFLEELNEISNIIAACVITMKKNLNKKD